VRSLKLQLIKSEITYSATPAGLKGALGRPLLGRLLRGGLINWTHEFWRVWKSVSVARSFDWSPSSVCCYLSSVWFFRIYSDFEAFKTGDSCMSQLSRLLTLSYLVVCCRAADS